MNRVADELDDVEAFLNRNDPFAPDVFNEAVAAEPEIYRYTCPLCRYEYESRQIRTWYREKGNKSNKPPIGCCPECGCAGGIKGWAVDWSGVDEVWRRAKIERERKRVEFIEIQKALKEEIRKQQDAENNESGELNDGEENEEIESSGTDGLETDDSVIRERTYYGQIELF